MLYAWFVQSYIQLYKEIIAVAANWSLLKNYYFTNTCHEWYRWNRFPQSKIYFQVFDIPVPMLSIIFWYRQSTDNLFYYYLLLIIFIFWTYRYDKLILTKSLPHAIHNHIDTYVYYIIMTWCTKMLWSGGSCESRGNNN